MRKNIKRTVALMLIISIYSIMEPIKYINLITSKVQADTTSIYLKSLSISNADIDFDSDKTNYSIVVEDTVNEVKITAKPKSDDSVVKINGDIVDSSDKYRKTLDLDDGGNVIKIIVENSDDLSKTYTLNITRGKLNSDNLYLNNIIINQGNINFQKETSSYDINVKSNIDKILIKAKPEDDNYTVKIDGTAVGEDDEYKQTVNLEKGKNEVIIQVENKKKKKRDYKINIVREEDVSGGETQDNIYLDFIKLSEGGEVNISKAQTLYNVQVGENVDTISIHAEPESTKYMVEIRGDSVEESDNYTKRDIKLYKGKNEIKIKIEDLNNRKRIYTLNIYKGKMPTDLNETSAAISNSNNIKTNQWIQTNGKWEYVDFIGNTIKNSWFYDKNLGHNYYLQADGSMTTGWLLNNSKWYYFGIDGAMKTGWILYGNKYYYLYNDGSMAHSTVINGYKLSEDGAWIV